MDKTVSIIMPIYNRSKTAKKSIESVLNQSFKQIELILINDGSTDDSEDICLQYKEKDKRVKYLKIQNSGPGEARNRGLSIANGKYIMFIDSDDYYDKDIVKIMMNCLISNNLECVICNKIKKEKNKQMKVNVSQKEMNQQNKPEFIEYLQKNNLFNAVWNKIYLKEIIDNNHIIFDKRFISGEDYKFNLDYFNSINNAKFINEFLYNYVMTTDSIVHNHKNNDFFIQAKIVDYNKKIYEQNNYNLQNIYYKYIVIAINGISYKIESDIKYKKVKEYIEEIIEYPSIQEIIKTKFAIGWEQKIFSFLLKHKMKMAIYLYVYARNIIKKIIYKIKGNI